MNDRYSNQGSRGRDQPRSTWGGRNADDDRDESYRDPGSMFRSQEDEQPMYGQYREAGEFRDRDRIRDWDREGRYGYGRGGDDTGGRSRYSGQGSYGSYGENRFGSNYRPSYGRDWGSSGTSHYGRSDFGSRPERGYQYGGWREPYGEGQQYPSGGGSSGMGYGYDTGYDRGRGLHRGKGPKGYQRTDERLREMICERLTEDPRIDASDVTVTVSGGKVTFDGSVDSRASKNAVEDVAEQLDVQDIQNNLRVTRSAAMSGGSTTSGDWGTGRAGTVGGRSLTNEEDTSRQKRN